MARVARRVSPPTVMLIFRFRPRPATHSATSSFSADWPKRLPSRHQAAVSGCSSSALLPMGLEAEVQNGMMVLPVRSTPSRKV